MEGRGATAAHQPHDERQPTATKTEAAAYSPIREADPIATTLCRSSRIGLALRGRGAGEPSHRGNAFDFGLPSGVPAKLSAQTNSQT